MVIACWRLVLTNCAFIITKERVIVKPQFEKNIPDRILLCTVRDI